MKRVPEGWIFMTLFALCIPAANFMIGHLGTACIPSGPCVIPVGFGLEAPSGVLMIGLSLVLRDLVQRRLGTKIGVLAIFIGAALSYFLAPPPLVLASTVAYLMSEGADLLVYTPMQRKGLVRAAVASSAVGSVIDSAVFLLLAFGSLDFIAGQVIGKIEMVALTIPVLVWIRAVDRRRGVLPV